MRLECGTEDSFISVEKWQQVELLNLNVAN